jgi:hypothetical protein
MKTAVHMSASGMIQSGADDHHQVEQATLQRNEDPLQMCNTEKAQADCLGHQRARGFDPHHTLATSCHLRPIPDQGPT